LRVSIHSFGDFEVYISIDGEEIKAIVRDYGRWNILEGNTDVLGQFQWFVEIKVFDVESHKLPLQGRDVTVQMKFDSGKISRFSGNFSRILNAVASHGHADSAALSFLRAIGETKTRVDSLLSRWEIVSTVESYGVGASSSRGGSRRQTFG
jgi:hypothetical protein